MQNIAFVFVIFISVTVFDECLGYPRGAPSAQCEQMTPSHGSPPQTGASPYEIKVTKAYYLPGKNVRVSIESSSDNVKGYLIQARRVGENSAIGTFSALPADGKYVNCGNSTKGAITHSSRLAVKTINFDWVPPSDFSGNVSFYATVVKNFSTFWVKLQSEELYKLDCTSGDPRCDSGAKLNHNILILLLVGILVFWQNMV